MSRFPWQHSAVNRRTAVQAGAVGMLGLGMNHLSGLREASAAPGTTPENGGTAKSCIYIFLSGGLAQQDSFDLKPDAPDTIRGEFNPIATSTPGIDICEHLPMLAQRSEHWAVCRSVTRRRRYSKATANRDRPTGPGSRRSSAMLCHRETIFRPRSCCPNDSSTGPAE